MKVVAYTWLYWDPQSAQFFGEVVNTNDQSPGSVTNPVTTSYAKYKTSYSGAYQSAALTEGHDLST